jgi:XTP/dITP diphosphohydrolase
MTSLVIATRNPGKVREIQEILAAFPELEIVSLDALGFEETPEEDALEVFDTFEENALAKARHFARLTGHLTLAEDSGICVDALGGAPGVRSRRFAPGAELRGAEQDEANNNHLLQQLAGMPESGRAARYVCAAALVGEDREHVFLGDCEGIVLEEPRGGGGFGYDPLFYIPSERCTFGELAPDRKNEISHRGRAIRAMAKVLAALD